MKENRKAYASLCSAMLIFGAEHEFFDRQDGYDGLVKLYNMTFKEEPKKMNVSLKYQAIGSGMAPEAIGRWRLTGWWRSASASRMSLRM